MDDPSFDKRLSDLDEGLDGKSELTPASRQQAPAGSQPSSTQPPTADRTPPTVSSAPPAISIFPESALTSGARPASPPSRFSRAAEARTRLESAESSGAMTPAPGARPLLDLFPPPSAERGRTRPSTGSARPERPVESRVPAIVGAPPPRLARSRFAQAESAPFSPAVPLTYEPFYGLSERPFSLSTEPKFIYHSTSHDRVLQDLIDALGRGDAIMLLTGETGIGKTTLCRSLVEQLGRRTVTSFLTDPVASLDDVLRTVLVDFGVVAREEATRGPMAAATRRELTAAVGDFAASLAPLQASAVIIVDEAQNVPPDILEALAALSEVADADRRVQLILVGQPALSSLLHRKQLRALERRVAVRCRLEPLAAEEVIGYVVHRLAIAGASARVEFDEAAFAELYAATRGVPRLVNLVCDGALTHGYEASASVIDDQFIAAAAADLELVPLRSDTRRFARMAMMAFFFLALMMLGAGAAAWVFRAQLSQLLAR
jgi:type II secretory pathway predicted ATPase ExeA